MLFPACKALCSQEKEESTDIKAISPIYYVGKIEIEDPMVVFCRSVPYITSASVVEKIDLHEHILLNSNKVYRYLTDSLLRTRYRPWFDDLIAYPEDVIRFADKYHTDAMQKALNIHEHPNECGVWKFSENPKAFVVLMISETAEVIIEERDIASGCGEGKIIWDMRPQTCMVEEEDGTLVCHQDYVTGYRYSDRYIPVVAPVWSRRQNGGIINE